jgi:multiple sugar transport system permease protein
MRSRRTEVAMALILAAPFIIVYGVLFIYPTVQMIYMSFTNAPLIGAGKWVGTDNYERLLFHDRRFNTALFNTIYFVVLTVIPNTLLGLGIALMINRLKGWWQSFVLALFFLPYILPVSVVYRIWNWMFDPQFGIAQYLIVPFAGEPVSVFRTVPLFMPGVALITVWWTNGFNVLLFLAGLRAISPDIYEAAALDNASRWTQFRRITWPLIWPVTALVFTIQLILQLKIFDQVYLFASGGRDDPTMVLVQYIYKTAFQQNKGGMGAAIASILFALIVVCSVLQFQFLRGRSGGR